MKASHAGSALAPNLQVLVLSAVKGKVKARSFQAVKFSEDWCKLPRVNCEDPCKLPRVNRKHLCTLPRMSCEDPCTLQRTLHAAESEMWEPCMLLRVNCEDLCMLAKSQEWTMRLLWMTQFFRTYRINYNTCVLLNFADVRLPQTSSFHPIHQCPICRIKQRCFSTCLSWPLQLTRVVCSCPPPPRLMVFSSSVWQVLFSLSIYRSSHSQAFDCTPTFWQGVLWYFMSGYPYACHTLFCLFFWQSQINSDAKFINQVLFKTNLYSKFQIIHRINVKQTICPYIRISAPNERGNYKCFELKSIENKIFQRCYVISSMTSIGKCVSFYSLSKEKCCC